MTTSAIHKPTLRQLDHVRASLFFSGFDDEEFDVISEHLQVRTLGINEILFSQGENADSLYFLDMGQVKITRISKEGNEKVVDIIKPGNTFGEALMFIGETGYPVNAVAVTHSQVIMINNQFIRGMLRDSVDSCFKLMAVMSKKLHFQIFEIDRLTLHSATYRLASYLLEQIPAAQLKENNTYTICLNAPKSVIASRLSIKPETFSRTLKRLVNLELLEVHDNKLLLKDINRLRDIVLDEVV